MKRWSDEREIESDEIRSHLASMGTRFGIDLRTSCGKEYGFSVSRLLSQARELTTVISNTHNRQIAAERAMQLAVVAGRIFIVADREGIIELERKKAAMLEALANAEKKDHSELLAEIESAKASDFGAGSSSGNIRLKGSHGTYVLKPSPWCAFPFLRVHLSEHAVVAFMTSDGKDCGGYGPMVRVPNWPQSSPLDEKWAEAEAVRRWNDRELEEAA